MSVADAITARGLAQRIQKALPTIQQNFFKNNALLAMLQQRNQIKWGGSHTEFDWYIRKEPSGQNPNWGGGNLSVRSFEELQPANQCKLPYSWLEKTYGVSDRTIEANRHAAGRSKIYDVMKEQLAVATIALYNTLGPAVWTGDGTGGAATGLKMAIGDAVETTNDVVVTAGSTYANRTLNTGAIANYNADRATMGWDDDQFYPIVVTPSTCPTNSGTAWSTDATRYLAWMADAMARTASISGTGTQLKPDYAFMNVDPYAAIKALYAVASAAYNIPVGNEKLKIAGWANIMVDTITCVRDTAVPDDTNTTPLERVFVLDVKEVKISTTHTKAEGLIINEFDSDNPLISGAIGVLKANLNYFITTPCAIGCVLGCNN